MTDDTVAACRAALLKTCERWQGHFEAVYLVDVDDAAACMARVMRAAWHIAWQRGMAAMTVDQFDPEVDVVAALAAAREVPHE